MEALLAAKVGGASSGEEFITKTFEFIRAKMALPQSGEGFITKIFEFIRAKMALLLITLLPSTLVGILAYKYLPNPDIPHKILN